jgi:hypothetical protein
MAGNSRTAPSPCTGAATRGERENSTRRLSRDDRSSLKFVVDRDSNGPRYESGSAWDSNGNTIADESVTPTTMTTGTYEFPGDTGANIEDFIRAAQLRGIEVTGNDGRTIRCGISQVGGGQPRITCTRG